MNFSTFHTQKHDQTKPHRSPRPMKFGQMLGTKRYRAASIIAHTPT